MLYGFFVTVLVLISILLIVVILLQGGRGGLGEALGGSGSQSLFGGNTNMAIAKFTTAGVATFFATCLILAMLSTARGRSVLEQVPAVLPDALAPSLGQTLPEEVPMTDATEDIGKALEEASAVTEVSPAAVEATVSEVQPAAETTQP